MSYTNPSHAYILLIISNLLESERAEEPRLTEATQPKTKLTRARIFKDKTMVQVSRGESAESAEHQEVRASLTSPHDAIVPREDKPAGKGELYC
jgi:hypothetical protein